MTNSFVGIEDARTFEAVNTVHSRGRGVGVSSEIKVAWCDFGESRQSHGATVKAKADAGIQWFDVKPFFGPFDRSKMRH